MQELARPYLEELHNISFPPEPRDMMCDERVNLNLGSCCLIDHCRNDSGPPGKRMRGANTALARQETGCGY